MEQKKPREPGFYFLSDAPNEYPRVVQLTSDKKVLDNGAIKPLSSYKGAWWGRRAIDPPIDEKKTYQNQEMCEECGGNVVATKMDIMSGNRCKSSKKWFRYQTII